MTCEKNIHTVNVFNAMYKKIVVAGLGRKAHKTTTTTNTEHTSYRPPVFGPSENIKCTRTYDCYQENHSENWFWLCVLFFFSRFPLTSHAPYILFIFFENLLWIWWYEWKVTRDLNISHLYVCWSVCLRFFLLLLSFSLVCRFFVDQSCNACNL